MLVRVAAAVALALAGLVAAGCDEADAASLHVRLTSPTAGEVRVNVLSSPQAGTAAEGALSGSGVTWDARAAVTHSRGSFSDVGTLKFQEVTFAHPIPGASRLEITIPRGPGVKWPLLLAGMTQDERERAGAVMTPSGEASKIGKLVKLSIEVPGKLYNSSLSRDVRGWKPDADGSVATLIVPVESALQDGPALRWTIEWDAK